MLVHSSKFAYLLLLLSLLLRMYSYSFETLYSCFSESLYRDLSKEMAQLSVLCALVQRYKICERQRNVRI